MENTKNTVKRGRKSVDDKVKPITIYVKESIIKSHGAEIKSEFKKLINQISTKLDNDTARAVILLVSSIAFCFADNIF